MRYYQGLFTGLSVVLLLSACNGATAQNPATAVGSVQYTTLEWTDLMPASDLETLLNPLDYMNEVPEGSIEDKPASMLKSSITEPADNYQQALISTKVRSELDSRQFRVAGYLVPLDFNDKQRAITFFAVPFFGACLHLPPPPPNQIILVHSDKGVHIEDMHTPYWLTGELHTGVTENDRATSIRPRHCLLDDAAKYRSVCQTLRPWHQHQASLPLISTTNSALPDSLLYFCIQVLHLSDC